MTPLELVKFLGLALFLAFLTESMVEYIVGKLCDLVIALAPVKPFVFYIALAVGIFLAFWYKIDLVAWFMSGAITPVGMVLSGLSIGRGANFIHDIIQSFFLSNIQKKQDIAWTKDNAKENDIANYSESEGEKVATAGPKI